MQIIYRKLLIEFSLYSTIQMDRIFDFQKLCIVISSFSTLQKKMHEQN